MMNNSPLDYYENFNFISKSTITLALMDTLAMLESGETQQATQLLRVLVNDLTVDWNVGQMMDAAINNGENYVAQ